MTAPRRRSLRKNSQPSPHTSREPSESLSVPPESDIQQDDPNDPHKRSEDDLCPACEVRHDDVGAASKEDWIRCDSCKTWYHWRCVGAGEQLENVDKWFCPPCIQTNPSRTITLKPPARKSSRKRTQPDYASLHNGLRSDPGKWLRVLKDKIIKPDPFKRMEGSSVSLEWLIGDDSAMREPFVVDNPDGLGMTMPEKNFTVADVADLVGPETPVEVMDVATQSNTSGYTLSKWVDYYNTEPAARDRIRNVISLEISNTKLAEKIRPPRLVRDLDWVEQYWPSNKKGKSHSYPKVQLYCLMGVAEAWTDWHIDFAGSSVYYHIFRGSKVFYFIRPTPANLAAYERWSGTDLQNQTWLGDLVDEVFKVELDEGQTMIIPTGWIHAVYTPVDSLVFGGNFLHSYNVMMQLRIRDIENATHVPKKFRFPFFQKLCWYVAEKSLRDLKAKEEFPSRVLESLEALANFLVSEVRMMERGSEHAKREVKDQIPSDRIKDGAALARELRWRVRLAANGTSGDEREGGRRVRAGKNGPGTNGSKRKRTEEESESEGEEMRGIFKNFKPKGWEKSEEKVVEEGERDGRANIPGDGWADEWMKREENEEDDEGERVRVRRREEVVVRVRRTSSSVERQIIRRTTQTWLWS